MSANDWSTDPRIPFQPPTLSIEQEAILRAAVPQPIQMTPLVFQLLKEIGRRCEHERLAWHGASVGPFKRTFNLHQQLANMDAVMFQCVVALESTVDNISSVWTKLMCLPGSKCVQIEHLLLNQPEFWLLMRRMIQIEQQTWN